MQIIQSPSPNHSSSSYDKTVVILHKTLGYMPWTLQWLQNPSAQVSAQYLITKKGEIHQLVADEDMAWHAGRVYYPSTRAKAVMLKTSWGSYVNPNKYSIGIENEALANDKWTPEQLKANAWLYKKLRDDPKVAFDGGSESFITHKDVTSYKPSLDLWRDVILKEVQKDEESGCEVVLTDWSQLGLKVGQNGLITIYKKS